MSDLDTEDLLEFEEYCIGYQQGRADAERDFQNSDEWNDYLAKVIADAKAEAIEEFINAYYEYCESQYGILADDEMVDMSRVKEKLIKEQK